MFRGAFPLAIVDLPQAASDTYDSYRELTEWLGGLGALGGTGGVLVMVCAAGESVQEEIWARQLGVWSYLPYARVPTRTLAAVEGRGISLLFGEAREVVEKNRRRPTQVTAEQGP